MARFLYLYGVFNAVSIFAALALGYLRGAGEAFYQAHVLAGLLSTLSAILGLVIVMFYLIYTGAAVKKAAKDKLVDAELYYETRRYKTTLFPWIMVSILSLLAAPNLGAAYDTGKAPLWLHHAAAWEVLIVLGIVTYLSKNILQENKKILNFTIEAVNADVERRRAGRKGATEGE